MLALPPKSLQLGVGDRLRKEDRGAHRVQRAQRAWQTVPSGVIKRGIPEEVSLELNF